jgi:hypothetical protein
MSLVERQVRRRGQRHPGRPEKESACFPEQALRGRGEDLTYRLHVGRHALVGDLARSRREQGPGQQRERRQIGVERVRVPKPVEADLGPIPVARDEAGDDLVDQERVPGVEEEVELLDGRHYRWVAAGR